MEDSVNITSLIANDVKEAEPKLIPEKSGKRYLKEYELFNIVNPYSAKGLGYRLYATLHKLPGKSAFHFVYF